MTQVRLLRSNTQSLQPEHWPPLDLPTGRRRHLNNLPNNVPENNTANNVNKNATAVPNQDIMTPRTANPMTANFNLGTPQGQKIFDTKTRGLPEDKKNEITTTEGAELRKYLFGRQAALGDVVTRIPIAINADGTARTTANLIKQYQSIPFEIICREAHKRYVGSLAHDARLAAGPHVTRQLDPENNCRDRAIFYKQVDANDVHQFLINSITATGCSNVLQGHKDEIQNYLKPEASARRASQLLFITRHVD